MILVITGPKKSLVVRAKYTKLVGKYQTAKTFHNFVSKQNVIVVGIVNVRSRNTHQRRKTYQRRPIQVGIIVQECAQQKSIEWS